MKRVTINCEEINPSTFNEARHVREETESEGEGYHVSVEKQE